ncbi:MAG: 50S ribosomal protein L21 [Patescibacteria group bacterium]
MQYAVIRTGGKQYLVRPGQKLKIEKLDAPEGGAILFDEVLLVIGDGDTVSVGAPTVKGAKVEAKVIRQARSKKVIVFKYRPKARHRKKQGHRQRFTEVEITKIITK